MTDLIIVGDEALTPEEYGRRERYLAHKRDYSKRPEVRAHRAAYMRQWRARNRERWNAYMREWMRRRRAA
jgi:hypothetical protein